MSRFTISPTALAGLSVIHRQPIRDKRGYFERLFCESDLQDLLQGKHPTQINHTFTTAKGILRGMHYQQPPQIETKMVSCLRGEVWDVAVDVRCGSPTFLAWYGEVLSEANHRSLLIPEGFAHGFQTLTDDCTMVYLHTAPYSHECEAALNPCDPLLAISWPLPVSGLSERDKNHPMITDRFTGISL